jgi:hypothetical protein
MGGFLRENRRWIIMAAVGTCLVAAPMVRWRSVHAASVDHSAALGDPPKAANPNPPATTPPPPTTGPATVEYHNDKQGVRLRYPSDWSPKADKDYVLKLVPDKHDDGRMITFDVPDLPPHLPGMITLGRMEKGYVDDLKKDHPGLKVEEATDESIPGGKGRLVRSTWVEKKEPKTDLGLLMMRGEHVYILAAQSPTAALDPVKAAFDVVAKSLQWAK